MSDRELLELAAKAAGIQWEHYHMQRGLCIASKPGTMCITQYWNPLIDDGDALRLAVRLGVAVDRTLNRCWVFPAGAARNRPCEEFYEGDPYAATRRAIVRAAAEIGRLQEGVKE